MTGVVPIPRPHSVSVTLSDEEFEDLEYFRGDGSRSAYFRALLAQAKENPDSSPRIHKHQWTKFGKVPVGWDKKTGRPLFKWLCVCSMHKTGPYSGSADRS